MNEIRGLVVRDQGFNPANCLLSLTLNSDQRISFAICHVTFTFVFKLITHKMLRDDI